MARNIEELGPLLERWALEICGLAERSQRALIRPGFDDLLQIDELRALHAITRAKLAEFQSAAGPERPRIEDEVRHAWSELDTAMLQLKDKN